MEVTGIVDSGDEAEIIVPERTSAYTVPFGKET